MGILWEVFAFMQLLHINLKKILSLLIIGRKRKIFEFNKFMENKNMSKDQDIVMTISLMVFQNYNWNRICMQQQTKKWKRDYFENGRKPSFTLQRTHWKVILSFKFTDIKVKEILFVMLLWELEDVQLLALKWEEYLLEETKMLLFMKEQ